MNDHSFYENSMADSLTPASLLTLLDQSAFYMEAVIFVLLPLELAFLLWRRDLNWVRIKEMLASASPIIPQILGAGFILGLHYQLFLWLEGLTPFFVETNIWTAALCLLFVDFLYYWEHRAGHHIRGLWALYHSVHHSSPLFDQTTALRVSLIDTAITPLFYLPAIAFGFDPLLVLLCFGFVIAYQTWIHTEMVGRLGWFDRIFNSPANHRVHHAVQRQYLDRNYGGVLILWDCLFGTYRAEEAQPVYGLTTPINSANPWNVHFHEIRTLFEDAWERGGFISLWRHFWHRPGWRE